MAVKLPISEIKKMNCKQISQHLEDITQTEICKDKKYCDELCKIFLSKPLSIFEETGQLKLF